ncbi:MAG: L-serine ammonia-lyase [Gammaproteobacteria bacterium]|nr:L-serine ammonia-lyase [Gammaproteobacteria bacterium]
MSISIFDIFKVGIGPSSSHTMGPMNAARQFALDLDDQGLLGKVDRVACQLYGSLAATGKGHCTDRAVMLGLEGEQPHNVDPDRIEETLARISADGCLNILGKHPAQFDQALDLLFHHDQLLPLHTNGMRFSALDSKGEILLAEEFYSIGGGFVMNEHGESTGTANRQAVDIPYGFKNAEELLQMANDNGLKLPELILANETVGCPEGQVRGRLLETWSVMEACIERGLQREGILPGILKVPRRALKLYRELVEGRPAGSDFMDWVDVWALAVNEENAAGGKIVTAPTNGAAGIVPAVLKYYLKFVPGASDDGIVDFLLAAGGIGILYKKNASISGAEMGCQGEVGVACSMAAAGLASAMGASNEQIENAAEIGMEHNLGLTCDPIAGLVQIPCIERNAMGSIKAINAARMALRGDGTHMVSLDQVIATMHQTGLDMSTRYKETSRGGLAVNVPEC